MRKRPEIPEDVFFDTSPAEEQPEPEEEQQEAPESAADDEDVLAKSMQGRDSGEERVHVKLSEVRAERARKRAEQEKQAEDEEEQTSKRVGRPPAQEGPKVAVTLYLTEPVAHLLEEVKFRLLTEYDVKTSKSAIADFAMRNGLNDLQAAADDLRRE